MAGKKIQAQLTPEEKLQQALVPEAEQPYKVPANWCWTRLMFIAKWASGGTPSRKKPKFFEGNIPWVKTGELNNSYIYDTEEHISEDALQQSSAKLFPINSILLAMYGATIGKVAILGIEAATNQACACAQCNETAYFKYVFYYLISQKEQFINKGQGGAQPNISQEIIKPYVFPLPPLAEQQRIVERIESLFAKLDEAKENLQNVLDGFETRKAAILHKAFTGELTANWRKQHGVSMDSWEEKKLGKIVKNIKDKYEPTLNNKKCIKYIGLEHIEKNNGIIGFGSSDDVKSLKTIFELGDILYGKLRPYLNKHDIAKFSGICSTDILVYRAEDFNTAKFINYFMNTEKFIFYTVSNSKGINLPRISEKEVSGILVNVPTLSEQSEIVRIIDDLLAKEQQAKKLAENTFAKIDIIKKAILARAFRGELGTNNPADEPAVELLKRVL